MKNLRENLQKRAEELGFSGKLAEDFIKNQMSVLLQEQKKRAREEAQLLGTTMQQLLPDIFETKRAIPNCFLRGALFGMVRKGKRKLVGDMPIFTMSQYDLSFTGYELDQNDLAVWDTLMFLAKERSIDSELRITLYDLCQQMKLKYTNTSRDALIARVKRLKTGTVTIKLGNKQYFGSLIDDGYIDSGGDGKLVIRYNKRLAPLFTDDYTFISADIRHLLGENQLARWLYNFYESHEKAIPYSLSFLQKLCRSETEPKDFKRKLKISLEEVKKAHLAVNIKSKWDYEITAKNYLIIYAKGNLKRKRDLFTKTRRKLDLHGDSNIFRL